MSAMNAEFRTPISKILGDKALSCSMHWILPCDSVGFSSCGSVWEYKNSRFLYSSLGSESVMMSFQGWNWTTGLIISRRQYLTEDQPYIGKPRRPKVPGWRWWGRKGGQPWAAAEHSNRKHSPLTSDQWSHQADHVSRISCFLNWGIDINQWVQNIIYY